MLFNLDKPPFDDTRMRLAFAYALDRTELNNVQYKGSRREAYSAFDPDTDFYAEGVGVRRKYNLQKAKELVAELKADGKPVDFTILCIPTDEARRLLGLAKTQMKKAGMKARPTSSRTRAATSTRSSPRAVTTRPAASGTPRSPAPTGSTQVSTPASRAT